MFYSFTIFLLQLQQYPPPAQTTREAVPKERKTRLVPPAQCLVGVSAPGFGGWGNEEKEGCLAG